MLEDCIVTLFELLNHILNKYKAFLLKKNTYFKYIEAYNICLRFIEKQNLTFSKSPA